jgi:hypothetical protein
MSDETPRRPIRETPAPDGPPPPGAPRHYETHAPQLRDRSSAGGFGTGMLAALGLAAVFAIIEALAVLVVMVVSVGPESVTIATRVGLLVLAAGFGVAMIVSKRLPRGARTSFWAMATVCLASALIVLVGVCGMKVPQVGG